MTSSDAPAVRRVALVTLGCARNEVDSEELAGRLAADGWELVDDASEADAKAYLTKFFKHAVALPGSGREATTAFLAGTVALVDGTVVAVVGAGVGWREISG